MPFKNIEHRLEYRKKWYLKNRKSEIAHVKRRKKQIKEWFKEYKEKLRCSKCKEDHPATLEFHHLGSLKKDGAVSEMVANGSSIKRILIEIKKCEMLCSNCHRKVHYIKINNL